MTIQPEFQPVSTKLADTVEPAAHAPERTDYVVPRGLVYAEEAALQEEQQSQARD